MRQIAPNTHLLALSGLVVALVACGTAPRNHAPAVPPGRAPREPTSDLAPAFPAPSAPERDVAEALENLCGPLDRVAEPLTPPPGDFILVDEQTHSQWNLRGEAFSGPCRGARLEPIPSFLAMWFSWSGTRPAASLWPSGTNDQPGPTRDASGECSVPCDDILAGGPPPDGIPALDHLGRWNRPRPLATEPVAESDWLRDDDRVLAVIVDGKARAYPVNLGWWHEIITDRIGDTEFSVTYCPLTASGIAYPTVQAFGDFVPYVSGTLFNSNLTMWERDSEDPTFWNQMLNRGVLGPRDGAALATLPVVEMTWERFRVLWPGAHVAGDDTGYSRDYSRYPYGDFETNHERWVVRPTLPFGDEYGAKDLVLAIDGPTTSRAWPLPALDAVGDRVAILDEHDGRALVVVRDGRYRFTQPFDRTPGDVPLHLEARAAP